MERLGLPLPVSGLLGSLPETLGAPGLLRRELAELGMGRGVLTRQPGAPAPRGGEAGEPRRAVRGEAAAALAAWGRKWLGQPVLELSVG